MASRMKVSIVIRTYNEETYLGDLLSAIQTQNLKGDDQENCHCRFWLNR